MRKRWGRWRGYMDELEEVMRVSGEHLGEAESLIADAWQRDEWRARQRDTADSEILRRARDIPFFRRLIEIAWRLGPRAEPSAPDFVGRPWRDGESTAELLSRERFAEPSPLSFAEPVADERPPARLRAAERALAERTRSLVVVLDNLVGARNASAVVRTSEALGLQEAHLIQREGKVALERTVTMLAQRWLDLHWYRDVADAVQGLRQRGYRILVGDFSPDADSLEEVPLGDKLALAFGGEQYGVSEELRAAADGFFYLPSAGFTSYLNVSVAAGISLYAIDRRMRESGLRQPLAADDRASLRRAWYVALARGDEGRARRYLAWLDRPPEPANASRGSRPQRKQIAANPSAPPSPPRAPGHSARKGFTSG